VERDEGEGEFSLLVHPHPHPPPSKGEGMFLPFLLSVPTFGAIRHNAAIENWIIQNEDHLFPTGTYGQAWGPQ
jgi:hypothetical protein